MKYMIAPARQLGLTVVELLVALVLSLLLLTGIIQVFLASKQTYATNEAMSVLQENGRFALEFIARSVHMAGYYDRFEDVPVDLPSAIEGGCGVNCSRNEPGNESDQLVVAFQPVPDPGTGKRYDCGGHVVPDTYKPDPGSNPVPDDPVVFNVFYVEGGSLKCFSYIKESSKQSSRVELVSGIDRLQVLYGIGTQENINRYVSADRVADWKQVLAVRVAVLANSLSPVNPAPPPRPYILLDAAPVSFDDRRARQIFTTTIQVKNIN